MEDEEPKTNRYALPACLLYKGVSCCGSKSASIVKNLLEKSECRFRDALGVSCWQRVEEYLCHLCHPDVGTGDMSHIPCKDECDKVWDDCQDAKFQFFLKSQLQLFGVNETLPDAGRIPNENGEFVSNFALTPLTFFSNSYLPGVGHPYDMLQLCKVWYDGSDTSSLEDECYWVDESLYNTDPDILPILLGVGGGILFLLMASAGGWFVYSKVKAERERRNRIGMM
jgi:hypothetical protein